MALLVPQGLHLLIDQRRQQVKRVGRHRAQYGEMKGQPTVAQAETEVRALRETPVNLVQAVVPVVMVEIY
jgi:hypothetical protein